MLLLVLKLSRWSYFTIGLFLSSFCWVLFLPAIELNYGIIKNVSNFLVCLISYQIYFVMCNLRKSAHLNSPKKEIIVDAAWLFSSGIKNWCDNNSCPTRNSIWNHQTPPYIINLFSLIKRKRVFESLNACTVSIPMPLTIDSAVKLHIELGHMLYSERGSRAG